MKPITRRVASSRLRSESEMRALLYTTPNAIMLAKIMLNNLIRIKFSPTVSRKFLSAASFRVTDDTRGVSLSVRNNRPV